MTRWRVFFAVLEQVQIWKGRGSMSGARREDIMSSSEVPVSLLWVSARVRMWERDFRPLMKAGIEVS